MKPGKDIFIGIDAASSEFYSDGTYNLILGGFESSAMPNLRIILHHWTEKISDYFN